MDRAERRQRLASETAEELEARLHHGGELVEGGVLHRAPHADTGRSLASWTATYRSPQVTTGDGYSWKKAASRVGDC